MLKGRGDDIRMSAKDLVHCHICPLIDLCPHSAGHESYKRNEYLTKGNLPANYDLAKIRLATANCPLRKKVLD